MDIPLAVPIDGNVAEVLAKGPDEERDSVAALALSDDAKDDITDVTLTVKTGSLDDSKAGE